MDQTRNGNFGIYCLSSSAIHGPFPLYHRPHPSPHRPTPPPPASGNTAAPQCNSLPRTQLGPPSYEHPQPPQTHTLLTSASQVHLIRNSDVPTKFPFVDAPPAAHTVTPLAKRSSHQINRNAQSVCTLMFCATTRFVRCESVVVAVVIVGVLKSWLQSASYATCRQTLRASAL